MVFVELIRLAPSYLNFPVDDELDDGMDMIENVRTFLYFFKFVFF